MAPGLRLNSWKEIAGFLGRDVRTVLRWEKERGLPVRCIPGGKKRRVFAYLDEVEAWLAGRSLPREPSGMASLRIREPEGGRDEPLV